MRAAAIAAVAVVALAATPADAIWTYDGTAPFLAQAPLNFDLTIGKFLFLQVGSPGAVIDTVEFWLAGGAPNGADQVQSAPFPAFGAALEAVAGGTQPVIVRGNQGTIALSVSGSGAPAALRSAAGATLGYDRILITSSNAGLPAPVIGAAGTGSATVLPTAHGGLVTDQRADWTFRLANLALPVSGTYTGQLTFTATMP